MSENSTKIIVRSYGQSSVELELEATIFRGKVCVAFKRNGSTAHQELANVLRSKLHEYNDPSIRDSGDVRTMNTRFATVGDMMDLLRQIGLRCHELPGQLPLTYPKSRIMVTFGPRPDSSAP